MPREKTGKDTAGGNSRAGGHKDEMDVKGYGRATKKEDGGGEMCRDLGPAVNVAAQVIRQLSGAGRFASGRDVLEELEGLGLLPEAAEENAAALNDILTVAIAAHPDLVSMEGAAGERRFYSSQFMTKTYAELLLRKEGTPLQLIAETVRENSALYPRPLPLSAFEQPPFSLTREEILDSLHRMAAQDIYRDIARTRTSAGNEYLYSTAHLDADYAGSLAEWIDVGQYDSP
jgi:hypothetical protein